MKRLYLMTVLIILLILSACAGPVSQTTRSTEPPATQTESETMQTITAEESNLTDLKPTLKEAYDMLADRVQLDDLKFFSYAAYSIDQQGRSSDMQIVCYSASTDKNYRLKIEGPEIDLKEIDNPDTDEHECLDINMMRNSPEIIAEAAGKLGTWDDDKGRLSIIVGKKMAEAGVLSTDIGLVDVSYRIE